MARSVREHGGAGQDGTPSATTAAGSAGRAGPGPWVTAGAFNGAAFLITALRSTQGRPLYSAAMNHSGSPVNPWQRRVPARYALLGAVIVGVLPASILAALTTPAGVTGRGVHDTVLTGRPPVR